MEPGGGACKYSEGVVGGQGEIRFVSNYAISSITCERTPGRAWGGCFLPQTKFQR